MENKGEAPYLYWTYLTQGSEQLVIAATSQGLCYVGSWEQSLQVVKDWAKKSYPSYEWVQDEAHMEPYHRQLKEYLEGERTSFSLPLDLQGTPFQRSVWDAMSQVPYGQTVSYLDVAQILHNPKSVRAVGSAIGKNPVLIVAPCHRIIGKNGGMTGYRGGIPMKQQLLSLESAGRH
ncbi:methylated-DNA--[protein]-cysteine S-methyltransferase [Cohnella abietis]|uniref:Methylated-DNA--protein-cysteine methyltransferase n=1 Tax=Cohnella abietis TaxID=2507935 RepID=A0A3T1D877_9BACL|nr:methylated-DNA--[protein]-cysteine S-methyltransferase [Cohnella abietis]BBI34255.1 methylated-DNA--protein-cysteine methyltransferase, inducible [Cohnella abietis]